VLLRGKVAVITGGASGIGLATAQRFGAEGARLCISTSNQEKLDRAVPLLRNRQFDVVGVRADVRQMKDVTALAAAALEAFGQIDILVCSQGYSHFGNVVDENEEEWIKVVDIDLIGCFRLSKAVLPAMIKQKWGRII